MNIVMLKNTTLAFKMITAIDFTAQIYTVMECLCKLVHLPHYVLSKHHMQLIILPTYKHFSYPTAWKIFFGQKCPDNQVE